MNISIWDTPTEQAVLDERQKADEVPFIGQEHIKAQVEPYLEGAKFPHVLLTGDPGLGKTQFARWLAWKRQKPFWERLAPVKPEALPPYGVLFLDEVHRQRDVEALFPKMEEGVLTIIAATTKPEKLDSAFKSRFLLTLRMRPYSNEEIEFIIESMAGGFDRIGGGNIANVRVLANAAQGNPRTAERIVKAAQGLNTWEPGDVLKSVQITADGLGQDHFDYLKALTTLNRPAGRTQIADLALMSEDDVRRLERPLIEQGYVELSPSGRKLTVRGKQYVSLLEDEGVI